MMLPMTHAEVPRYGAHAAVLGLPARAVALTHSERTLAYCAQRWYFGEGLGLRPDRRAVPLEFGTAGHDALEDVYRWWMVEDSDYPGDALEVCVWCARGAGWADPCPRCGGFRLGPVARAGVRWEREEREALDAGLPPDDEDESASRRTERLRRSVDGYLARWGRGPPEDCRVVAVEVAAARPILPPGKREPYAPDVPLARVPGGGWRLARPEDAGAVSMQRLPWYALGRIDAVLASRRTGKLWVVEHKFTSSPDSYTQSLAVDPQTAGYVWMLEAVADALPLPADVRALLGSKPGSKVAGYLYDVASSSYQHDPAEVRWEPPTVAEMRAECAARGIATKGLRSSQDLMGALGIVPGPAGLSRDSRRTTPSWRYERAVADRGLDPADYAEHVSRLRQTVDQRLYLREHGTLGRDERDAYAEELYAVARRHADMRRAVVETAGASRAAIRAAFPRSAVCALPGGRCAWRGPCCADGEQARASFVVRDGQTWHPTAPDQLRLPGTDTGTPTVTIRTEAVHGRETDF